MCATHQVHKCTDEERLDSQSIVLTVDQRGTVLQTSPSPKNLFGFDPQSELIGRPLAAFINVFEEFRMQQQQQGSSSREGRAGASFLGGSSGAQDQYSKLALQIGPGPDESSSSAPPPAAADDSMLLTLLVHAAQEGSEACYRVGVHSRVLQPEQIGQDRAATDNSQGVDAGGKMSLLQVLGKHGGNQLRPALMRIDVVQTDWTNESADNQGMRFKVRAPFWNVKLAVFLHAPFSWCYGTLITSLLLQQACLSSEAAAFCDTLLVCAGFFPPMRL